MTITTEQIHLSECPTFEMSSNFKTHVDLYMKISTRVTSHVKLEQCNLPFVALEFLVIVKCSNWIYF